MENKKESFQCPTCTQEISYVYEWDTISKGTHLDLASNTYDSEDCIESDSSFFEGYSCPECNSDVILKFKQVKIVAIIEK